MTETVTDIIVARSRQSEGLQTMVIWSSAGHVLLMAALLFSGGRVVEDAPGDETARDIKAFNAHAAEDPRVDLIMLPIADGLTLARKL